MRKKKIIKIFLLVVLLLSVVGYYLLAQLVKNNDVKIFCYICMVFEIIVVLSFLLLIKKFDQVIGTNRFLFVYAVNPFLAIIIFGAIATIDLMAGGLS